MTFWVLALSYWIHLLATVIWLGGMALMAFIAWPALRRGTLDGNQWFELQKRFAPWVSGSLIILLITGFVQMTNDANYNGFLVFDSVWAWAILLKHIAFLGMVVLTVYLQFFLYPSMTRINDLTATRPDLIAEEQATLSRQEIRMLRINLACAAAVLFFTAIATAV